MTSILKWCNYLVIFYWLEMAVRIKNCRNNFLF
jgi:hypothetical protein